MTTGVETSRYAARYPELGKLVEGLSRALGNRLQAMVLYGSAARGDARKGGSDLNIVVVIDRLDVEALETMAPALTRWTRAGQPLPRMLTPALIAESADVFPIEFHDIRSHGVTLHGANPFAQCAVSKGPLRLQCEREMREKMMRLREGYVLCHDKPKELVRLMTASWGSFAAIFRGCLHLMNDEVPVHDVDVVEAFCRTARLEKAPLLEVGRLKEKGRADDPRALFLRYYQRLQEAVRSVDRFQGGASS